MVDDSAYPVAANDQRVLISPIETGPNPEATLRFLRGRIVAIVTRPSEAAAEERQAYLKRLGQQMPGEPTIWYMENVGQQGEGGYIQFGEEPDPRFTEVPLVDGIWRVHGVIY